MSHTGIRRHAPCPAHTLTALVFTGLLMNSAAFAADWQNTNIQLLHGTDYADDFGIDDKEKTVFTFEHADGWGYGDNFFFLDVSNPTADHTSNYAEFGPRLSLGKLTGKDLSFPLVKDVLIAADYEFGTGVRAALYGIGLALDLPGFAFADVNYYIYRKSNSDAFGESDTGSQITLDWLLPFSIGPTKWAFEGFFDYAYGENGGANPKEDNIITAPRLLVDIGDLWGKPGSVQVGIEYQIWRNKYGIKDVDEDVAQIMVKWTI